MLRGRVRFLAVLAVAALIATACSSSDGGDSGSSGSGNAVPSALTSFFPGKAATGEEITIGLYNPEGGQFVNQPEDREAARAAVDYANAELGGIGGRKIKLFVCKGLKTTPTPPIARTSSFRTRSPPLSSPPPVAVP